MATPSPGYAITVRVETPSSSGATSGLVAAVSTANGVLTALDVVESHVVVPFQGEVCQVSG